jgi:hypothetical protein
MAAVANFPIFVYVEFEYQVSFVRIRLGNLAGWPSTVTLSFIYKKFFTALNARRLHLFPQCQGPTSIMQNSSSPFAVTTASCCAPLNSFPMRVCAHQVHSILCTLSCRRTFQICLSCLFDLLQCDSGEKHLAFSFLPYRRERNSSPSAQVHAAREVLRRILSN